ncbi:hypothetical protein ACJIZ3_022933 [Penstemon smallii]|uniref:CDP-diacylglycerol--glycerol-3-phosphate 1-phosphatidyltransferase n=1 Tax=Penstemon smallii TaxID=265156 RepID=A0ABD3TPR1_9LAMI
MPTGVPKLTNLSFIHSHKPYNIFLNHLSSSSATVESSRASVRWRMTTSYAATAHPKFTSTIIRRGSKSHFFTSDSAHKRQELLQSDRNLDSNHCSTRMRATVNGKVDDNQFHVPPPPQKLLTLPTILTIGRVAAVPILVSTFYVESWWGPTATTSIFIAAAITDWLDGYLARRMKLGTPFGAFLDPVADKLMVASTLILLCTKPFDAGVFGQAPWLLTAPAIAIIGREITMSAVREWAASQDKKLLEAVAVNNLGKWKTATQMSALTILLACRDNSLVGAGTFVSCGVVLLYISAWLALWSLFVYMRKISKVLLR